MSLKPYHHRAMELGRQRDAKIAERRAEAQRDELMTTEQRTRYVEGWTKTARRDYDRAMADLRSDAEYLARQTREDGQRLRPKFDPNSAADLTRTEQAWRNVVLPQLEKGASLSVALRNADHDAVLGAERFAPAWLATNSRNDDRTTSLGLDPGRDHAADVNAVATARFADLVGPKDGPAIRAAGRVDAELDAFNRIATMTDEGKVGLDAAILSHYSSQDIAPVDDGEGDTAA